MDIPSDIPGILIFAADTFMSLKSLDVIGLTLSLELIYPNKNGPLYSGPL